MVLKNSTHNHDLTESVNLMCDKLGKNVGAVVSSETLPSMFSARQ